MLLHHKDASRCCLFLLRDRFSSYDITFMPGGVSSNTASAVYVFVGGACVGGWLLSYQQVNLGLFRELYNDIKTLWGGDRE